MGLDTVELIMRVEEEFDITIEDAEAEYCVTPGTMCALIERKLGIIEANKRSFCPTSRAFYRVRRELVACGIERAHIKPQAQLNAVLPLAGRDKMWRQLEQGLAMPLPPISRSTPSLLDKAVEGYLRLVGGSMPPKAEPKFPFYGVRSIADVTRRVALASADVPASQRDVWPQLQLIIADELSIPIEQVTRDADFFRDLGMG